jgi:hypothetical protein
MRQSTPCLPSVPLLLLTPLSPKPRRLLQTVAERAGCGSSWSLLSLAWPPGTSCPVAAPSPHAQQV